MKLVRRTGDDLFLLLSSLLFWRAWPLLITLASKFEDPSWGPRKTKVRKMSEELDAEAVAALRKKRQFKKFTFRGLEVEKIMDLSREELLKVVHAR